MRVGVVVDAFGGGGNGGSLYLLMWKVVFVSW